MRRVRRTPAQPSLTAVGERDAGASVEVTFRRIAPVMSGSSAPVQAQYRARCDGLSSETRNVCEKRSAGSVDQRVPAEAGTFEMDR
jgi:hypothetical protein